jgi:hypothetical protein
MPVDREQTARLRELHDNCVWKVNAAVAEGREDLIQLLSGEYLEQAVRILAEELPATGARCGREDCGVCRAPRAAPPRRSRGWRDRLDAAFAAGRSRQR